MADYWKSQPRHFCDFCKCWTADNKPSREFHEKGKRHQENVKKKLDELRKKGLNDAKQEKEMSGYLKQMEQAALMKLKEDLQDNPAMASQYGVIVKRKEPSKKEDSAGDDQFTGEWVEATTDEGYVYYWNTVTRESRWEIPEAEITPQETILKADESSKPSDCKRKKRRGSNAELDSVDEEELSQDRSISTTTSLTQDKPLVSAEQMHQPDNDKRPRTDTDKGNAVVSNSCSPYGQWQHVSNETSADQALIDLQLPVCSTKEQTVVITEEPKIKFREKKLTSLPSSHGGASSTSISFRKPKAGVQRNFRTTDSAEET